ncbi:hypothetical protein FJZ19_04860 [Candidatus Pacearchaeota archaeon]|nr:hypothetical protein [Candidatus Pacearchaeota archaeon]
MKINRLIFIALVCFLFLNFVSASRLPSIGGDNETWGNILNDYLTKLAGTNATQLNLTMVNGTNIYSSSINSSHIQDNAITSNKLVANSVTAEKIDLTSVKISNFTNDANYLDKDEGGTIDGSLIVNGNFTLIGSYLNATVINQYLNGSFFPEITNIFNIGSSLLKWANIFVTNLYASKVYSDDWSNVTITKSQVSDFGSYLESESDPVFSSWDKDYGDLINKPTIPTLWDSAFNNTGDTRWGGGTNTQKKADGNYLYNDTTTIYFNETKLNATIDNKISGISGGNASFNQSLTDTLYAGIEWNYNQTIPANAYTDSVNQSTASWIEATFLKIANLVGAVGNWSADKPNYYNKTDVDSFNESWSSTYNATYATWSYNQTTPAIDYASGINTSLSSRIDGISGGNASFNQSLTDTLYAGIEWNYNQTTAANKTIYDTYNSIWSSTYNATYAGYVAANYTNKSNFWDNMDTINTTQMQDDGGTLNILVSWLTSLFYTESEVDTKLGTANLHTHAAENISAGNFGTGNYNFSNNLTFNSNNQGIKMGNAMMYWNGSALIIKVT